MVGKVTRRGRFSALGQKQRRAEGFSKVEMNSPIFCDAFLKRPRPMDTIATVDCEISFIKGGIVRGASCQSVTHIYPLEVIGYGPRLDVRRAEEAALTWKGTRFKTTKD